MKKVLLFIIFLGAIIAVGVIYKNQKYAAITQKVYVASEGDGIISVVDPVSRSVIRRIDLSKEHDGVSVMYSPHNVQVSPDRKTVWVTANIHHSDESGFRFIERAAAHSGPSEPDEVVVIDAATDKITARITTVPAAHLAHVVLSPDGRYAYATAQAQGMIYKFDTQNLVISKMIKVPDGTEPHGLRISPDGSTAYIAMFAGKALGILNLADDSFRQIPLGGLAVQAGVTPDGRTAMVSLYDTKQLALYDIRTGRISRIQLPASSKGPIQMFPSPDSKFVYLADQGYYNGQPGGNTVYKIDIESRRVMKEIKVGDGPHGVAVAGDGSEIYITNLMSGDLSIISSVDEEEIVKIPVGKLPNGVSVWFK